MKCLSLDGGGIGGIYTSSLLERLEEETGNLFCSNIDAIAGTSTGSIIACALGMGMSPKDISNLYFELAPKVFRREWYNKTFQIDRIFGAPYKSSRLESLLRDIFGNRKLGDLSKKILIPTLDLDREKFGVRQSGAKFISSFGGTNDDSDHGVVEAIMKSASAPTYFAPYENRFVDGGLIQNNPAAAMVVECTKQGLNKEQIILISLGTGKIPPYVDSTKAIRWGVLNFVRPLIDSLTNSNMDVSDKFAQRLLGVHYKRYSKALSRKYDIDDPAAMRWIYDEVKTFDVRELVNYVKAFFNIFTKADVPRV